MKCLLDSCIVIDDFNPVDAATVFLREQGGECALSAITRAEVLAGFKPAAEAPALRSRRPITFVIPGPPALFAGGTRNPAL